MTPDSGGVAKATRQYMYKAGDPVDGSSHGETGDCTTDSETFQAQDCTTCPRVRTRQSQTIEKDT